MKTKLIKNAIFAALVSSAVIAPYAMADHNSVWGDGWANMPNDIHNTRLDPAVSDTEFMEFVSGGAGAESVNRYVDDDDSTTTSGSDMAGSFNQGSAVATGGRDMGQGGR